MSISEAVGRQVPAVRMSLRLISLSLSQEEKPTEIAAMAARVSRVFLIKIENRKCGKIE
jgi:hypothetical protein